MSRRDGLLELIDRINDIRRIDRRLDPCTRTLVLLLSQERDNDPANLTSLPRVPGYTGRTVRKWCRRTLGICATTLRKWFVVERSFELLVGGPYTSLEWLATRLGYASYSALSRAWTAEAGVSPSIAARALQRNLLLRKLDDPIRAAARLVDAEVDRRSRGGGLRYTPSRRCS